MSVIEFLKNTDHFHLVFERPSDEDRFLARLLDWLNAHSVIHVDAAAIEAHLNELKARRAGGRSLPDVAARTGQMIQVARAVTPLLHHYAFATYDLGYAGVSVDLFNPAGELGIPEWQDELVVEVFLVLGKGDSTGAGLRRVLREMVLAFPVKHAFGGYAAFTARYVNAVKAAMDFSIRPSAFLWPLTFVHGQTKVPAPVQNAERVDDGLLIQVFEGLGTGNANQYRDAARSLGLTSLWDVSLRGEG